MQRGSALLYSDQLRFESDFELANNLHTELSKIDSSNKQILLYGHYNPAYPDGYVYGEDIGKSMFNVDSYSDITNASRSVIHKRETSYIPRAEQPE